MYILPSCFLSSEVKQLFLYLSPPPSKRPPPCGKWWISSLLAKLYPPFPKNKAQSHHWIWTFVSALFILRCLKRDSHYGVSDVSGDSQVFVLVCHTSTRIGGPPCLSDLNSDQDFHSSPYHISYRHNRIP